MNNGTDEQQSGMAQDNPTYLMEHLATFTVTKETGIVYPADGMRRLLQLEKSNGIWSQKMQLRLDHNWVLIMDYETGVGAYLHFILHYVHYKRITGFSFLCGITKQG